MNLEASSEHEKGVLATNIIASIFLAVGVLLGAGGVVSYTKSVMPQFCQTEECRSQSLNERIQKANAWKFMHITAVFFIFAAVGIFFVGNKINDDTNPTA